VTAEHDQWHRWLLDVRHGGDAEYREQILEALYPVRDEVLDRAALKPGDTVLDVGTGDGLVAFGALERLGPEGRVIFSDVSQDLLDHCRAAVTAAGQLGRCDFLLAPADRLDGMADAFVDVVTTRSVLIYVADKAAAFREFRRVLRPGGRISLFEPVNSLMPWCDPGRFFGYDVSPVAELAAKVTAVLDSIQPSGQDPMLDFDDRDLVRMAEQAGFADVSLDLRVTVQSRRPPSRWEVFLRTSGNPLMPPLGEVFARALSESEEAEFSSYLRPLVESGTGGDRRAVVFLTAE